jgi:hypothetical protein
VIAQKGNRMEPLALQLDTLDGLTPERAGLYEPITGGEGFQLALDTPPDALLKALREERAAVKVAEKTVATVTNESAAAIAERDAALAEAAAVKATLLDARTRECGALVGLHTGALRDASRAAAELFTINASGAVVARDGSKRTLAEWLQSQRNESPHWFPATASGSGALQSQHDASGGRVTIRRGSFESLRPAQRAAALASGMQIID